MATTGTLTISLKETDFLHSSLCTISTVIQGIPFLIPCRLAALILLVFFKAHLVEGLSERKTHLQWQYSEVIESGRVTATKLQVSLC